jgi:hypothetical protein
MKLIEYNACNESDSLVLIVSLTPSRRWLHFLLPPTEEDANCDYEQLVLE